MRRDREPLTRLPRRYPGLRMPTPAVLCLLGTLSLIELVLFAADRGVVGSQLWRSLSYQYGAFWPGLLGDWHSNYPLQPLLMFLTYPLLHSGVAHLLGNAAVLLVIGHVVERALGPRRFLLLYVVSGIGGGLGYALLSSSVQPMVGASGAIFGVAGAWKQRDWAIRTAMGVSRKTVIVDIFGLALLNVLFWLLEDGMMAWEAHLGGFLTGWMLSALFSRRRPRQRS